MANTREQNNMPIRFNGGAKLILYIGGAIVVCISVTVYLIQLERVSCPLPDVKEHLEEKIDFHYKVISEDISEIKEDIKLINSKLK